MGFPMSGEGQLKRFNELCKMYSRHRLLPRSTRILDHSWESTDDDHDRYGGQAVASQRTHKGKQVAAKVPYLYLTSEFDSILSVSVSSIRTFHRF